MPADEREWLTERFEQHRPSLRAAAYRMLGSVTEADDALQEAWLRVRDQDPRRVENMQAWLTTIVGRVCLNMLRSRRARLQDSHVPDPEVRLEGGVDPEQETLVAESVGLALLVVLDTLTPAERLAFVLHDVFGVPFADIATALDRSEAAAQQLASRARRRVRGAPEPDHDLARQRRVVDAFFAASRDGDFDALLAVLDPNVELRIDGGALREDASRFLRGADAVARHTATYSALYPFVRPALVNGAAGAVVAPHGRVFSVMGFTVTNGKIVQIDALLDPDRLARLELL
ncbi:MAG TPA: sigma-70 family RNA polymerase sigma factor [Solirubrobacteraceae bacterium]|nr:sigma-70 family RNA polymerase sigma factor [Solirubrobacteraceae bacterium]